MQQNIDIVLGCSFGDEGKGKLVDILAGKYDYTCRFNGGNNAGILLPNRIKKKKKLFIKDTLFWQMEKNMPLIYILIDSIMRVVVIFLWRLVMQKGVVGYFTVEL